MASLVASQGRVRAKVRVRAKGRVRAKVRVRVPSCQQPVGNGA